MTGKDSLPYRPWQAVAHDLHHCQASKAALCFVTEQRTLFRKYAFILCRNCKGLMTSLRTFGDEAVSDGGHFGVELQGGDVEEGMFWPERVVVYDERFQPSGRKTTPTQYQHRRYSNFSVFLRCFCVRVCRN